MASAQQSQLSTRSLGTIFPQELARELGCDVRTLARWRTARTGPAFVRAPGARRIIYRREAVDAWLKANEIPAVREGRTRKGRAR